MIDTIQEKSKKLGAFARASLAADFTDEAGKARSASDWTRANTLLAAALELQPRRDAAKKMLSGVRSAAAGTEGFSENAYDSSTVEFIEKKLSKALLSEPKSREVAVKAARSRRAPGKKRFTLSLAFAVFFSGIIGLYLIFGGTERLFTGGGIAGKIASIAAGLVVLAGGYFLIRMSALGLIFAGAGLAYVFAEFVNFYNNGTIDKRPELQGCFFMSCLPAFFLLIVILMNIRRLLRYARAGKNNAPATKQPDK